MTEKQASRLERNNEIEASFKALRKKYPTSSLNLITKEISKSYQMTPQGILAVCKKRGLC